MLKKFEVEGLKNFDYPLVIDFSDIKQYAFNKNCIRKGLLNKVVVYEKNAIGKSNLGLAIFDIVTHLADKNVSPQLYDYLYDYYLNYKGKYDYATFSYTFQFDHDEVVYTYKKTEFDNLLFESLVVNSKLLFKHDSTEESTNIVDFFNDEFKSELLNSNFDYNDASISTLRYIINNSQLEKGHVVRKIYDFVSHMLWFRNSDGHRFIGLKDSVKKANDYYEFIFEGNNLELFQKFLKSAGIDDKLIVRSTPDKEKVLYISGNQLLPFFKVASNGTKALYAYFYWSQNKGISFLFIDEFDAYYPYELSEILVAYVVPIGALIAVGMVCEIG